MFDTVHHLYVKFKTLKGPFMPQKRKYFYFPKAFYHWCSLIVSRKFLVGILPQPPNAFVAFWQ
jgi:hypothetical protein